MLGGRGRNPDAGTVTYHDPEPRRTGVGVAVFAIAVIASIGYLALAAFQGEHGLFSLFRIEAQEARLRAELTALQAERAAIRNETERLSAESLDLDLLDEQARKVLGLGRPDEIIIR
jgi:cell division protein FtsB